MSNTNTKLYSAISVQYMPYLLALCKNLDSLDNPYMDSFWYTI